MRMRSKLDTLDLNPENWDMAERRAAEDATLCANHFKTELEKVRFSLMQISTETTTKVKDLKNCTEIFCFVSRYINSWQELKRKLQAFAPISNFW